MEQLPPKAPAPAPLSNIPFPWPNSWVDEFMDFSSTRRNAHRRTLSDPIAFVEQHLDDDHHLQNMFSDDLPPPSVMQPKTEPGADPLQILDHHDTSIIHDPKRIKRILANRQSAQRSRVRKLHYISELERSVSTLQTEVSTLSPRVAFLDHHRLLLNVDNSALKQRIAALAQDKIFKDAHQEALKKEIERLRKVYHQQNMTEMDGGAAEKGRLIN